MSAGMQHIICLENQHMVLHACTTDTPPSYKADDLRKIEQHVIRYVYVVRYILHIICDEKNVYLQGNKTNQISYKVVMYVRS